MIRFSDELCKKNFPNLDVVLENIKYALHYLKDEQKLTHMKACHQAIEEKNVPQAVAAAHLAGYDLMSQAIPRVMEGCS